MNGFIIFGIMFMTATGLENSPQSFGVYTVSQSRSVVTSAENPAPDNSPQSIGELRNGHVANLQELYYNRLVRKMAWYKILIHVLIPQNYDVFPLLMMHKTCSINYGHLADLQKTLPTNDLNKKKLSFDKISPHDFYFFPFFSICTCLLRKFNVLICIVSYANTDL